MNIEEDGYWSPGLWERLKIEGKLSRQVSTDDIGRDRNVKIKPGWLEFMLQQVGGWLVDQDQARLAGVHAAAGG